MEKRKYKNEKPESAASFLVRSNGAIERIGPDSEDNNQIATWGGPDGGINSTNLEDLLANWNPNPEYICLLGSEEPKNRPYKEALVEGDLWWNTQEKHLYVYEEGEWVSTTTGPSGLLVIAGQWNGAAGQLEMTFNNGVLSNVVVGSAST